jgi:uncharacterized membrane protein YfcA
MEEIGPSRRPHPRRRITACNPSRSWLATQGADLAARWPLIAILVIGSVVGTLLGGWTLRRMDEALFRRVVGVLLLVLGVYTLARALS